METKELCESTYRDGYNHGLTDGTRNAVAFFVRNVDAAALVVGIRRLIGEENLSAICEAYSMTKPGVT